MLRFGPEAAGEVGLETVLEQIVRRFLVSVSRAGTLVFVLEIVRVDPCRCLGEEVDFAVIVVVDIVGGVAFVDAAYGIVVVVVVDVVEVLVDVVEAAVVVIEYVVAVAAVVGCAVVDTVIGVAGFVGVVVAWCCSGGVARAGEV